jgi:protein-disulfide isomerase
VLDKYPEKIKLVFRNFPLANHTFARTAAAAALAADRQGKFWEFHDRLFQNYNSLDHVKIQNIASVMGLDMTRFTRDMKDPAIQRLILRDMREGQKAGVRGTPTMFINGKLVKKRNLQDIQQMIDGELKKSG